MALSVEHVPEKQVYLDCFPAVFTENWLFHVKIHSIIEVHFPPLNQLLSKLYQMPSFFLVPQRMHILLVYCFPVISKLVKGIHRVIALYKWYAGCIKVLRYHRVVTLEIALTVSIVKLLHKMRQRRLIKSLGV